MNHDFLDAFIRELRVERNLRPASCASYRYQILAYLRFLDRRRCNVSTAVREDVIAFLESKLTAGHRSSSRYAATIAIRQFHRFLAASGITISDPTLGLRLPKMEQRLPAPLSAADMDLLLMRPLNQQFGHLRDCAALELMYSSGIRAGELTAINTDHLDAVNGHVRVRGKGCKERLVPVGPRAKEALGRYIAARQQRFPSLKGALFLNSRGGRLTRGGLWLRVRQAAKRAGVTSSVSPHRIRHTVGTALLAGGADIRIVQEILGHSAITTTQIYTHVSLGLLKTAVARSHPRF